MPNKTVYIRKDDIELWDKLPQKAEVIHKLLMRFKEQQTKDAVHYTEPEAYA